MENISCTNSSLLQSLFQLKKTRFSASLPSNLATVASKGKRDNHIQFSTYPYGIFRHFHLSTFFSQTKIQMLANQRI